MTRNLKPLGLALTAALTMGALTASSAAGTDLFTTDGPDAWTTGVSHNTVFKTPVMTFGCTTSKFTGTIDTAEPSTMTVLASYSRKINETPHIGSNNCEPIISMNGCHYVLSGDTDGEDLEQTDATFWIVCPEGKEIEMTFSNCAVKVPGQTPTAGGVTYSNLPNHKPRSAIQVTTTVTGLTYSATPGFACGFKGFSSEGDNLDLEGTIVLTGYEHTGGTFVLPILGDFEPIQVS
ncbi:MAG TPA: hypothetical protein VIS95_05470 [Solirubrobacterales bacterium]